jgi:GNAT superfamily N-acetyltransferase
VNLRFSPLTPNNWKDFEQLFGTQRGCSNCWCMFWHLTREQFNKGCKSQNKMDMKELIESGKTPGILGYIDSQAVGWCSIAPREEFASLERSRILKRIDEAPVWSIVCFFVRKDFQRKGILREMIQGAVDFAELKGAKIIEAYPNLPSSKKHPAEMYMGNLSTFLNTGFIEVARTGSKIIVRKKV